MPVVGWGHVLAEFVDDVVHNCAVGGATTASFRAEGHWDRVVAALQSGDTVVIQFGHNDQKEPDVLAANGGYRRRLTEFVAEVCAAGARPVLATSVERRLFAADGALVYSHGPYPAAVRALGHELDVPVIDLTVFTRWLYTCLGPDESARLFAGGVAAAAGESVEPPLETDNTHYTTTGARAVAHFVALSLRALDGADDELEPLGSWIVQP